MTEDAKKAACATTYAVPVKVQTMSEFGEFKSWYNLKEIDHDVVCFWEAKQVTEEAFDYFHAVISKGFQVDVILASLNTKFRIQSEDALYAFIDFLDMVYSGGARNE